MDLSKLTKRDLLKLKDEIDIEIKKKVRTIKPKKNSLSSLKVDDKIFGFRLSAGPHKLLEPAELNCSVDIIDYCYVTGNEIRDNGEIRLNISHKEKAFGIGTTLSKEDADKHYLLIIDQSKGGYDGFYTLKPKTWEEDFKKALVRVIDRRRSYFESNIEIINTKAKVILDSKDLINEYL